ncbi:MAG: putative glycolipid-binding domain-containing protein [Anaerolineales bacterium]|jgi:hypothetical protein
MREAQLAPRASILWHRLDRPGHEIARFVRQSSGWHLSGTSVFAHEHQPCQLDYQIICDTAWYTRSARVVGWLGAETIDLELKVDANQCWVMNDEEYFEVEGCTDLDLNFSPATNLLPIRRLNLAVGEAATVKAAWLRFPSFNLEPLEQVYRRLETTVYRYESAGGRFVTELQVNAAGFVTNYPDIWVKETGE